MKLIIDGDNLLFKMNNEKLWIEDNLKTTVQNLESTLNEDDYDELGNGLATAIGYISALRALDRFTGIVRSCSMNNACEFCTHNTGYDEFGMCLCTEYVCTLPKNRCEKYEGKK